MRTEAESAQDGEAHSPLRSCNSSRSCLQKRRGTWLDFEHAHLVYDCKERTPVLLVYVKAEPRLILPLNDGGAAAEAGTHAGRIRGYHRLAEAGYPGAAPAQRVPGASIAIAEG